MSRAFVKEQDGEIIDDLPDRPVSEHPNFVTAQGLALIEDELARAHAEYAKAQAQNDRAALARTGRALRYWTARRSTAQVIAPLDNAGEVHFGVTVTLEREVGRKQTCKQTWRIVGEDEADPTKGTISHISPLARALYGKRVGDVVQAGQNEAEIVAIS
jgi:transcription elongation GreA/GreB family factor